MLLAHRTTTRMSDVGIPLAIASVAVIAVLLFVHPFAGNAPVRELSPNAPLPTLIPEVAPAAPRQITIDAAPTDSNAELIAPGEVRSSDPGRQGTPASPTVQVQDVAPGRGGPGAGLRIAQRAEERGSPLPSDPINPRSK